MLKTNRPLVSRRAIGPGVGDQASPESSSRTKIASAVGSTIGSFANDVSRFSRLFSDHVCAEPERRHDGAETGVGDDVRPRQRRFLIAVQNDPVGATLVREAAEAVAERRRRLRDRRSGDRRSDRCPAAPAANAGRRTECSRWVVSSWVRRSPRSPATTARAAASISARSVAPIHPLEGDTHRPVGASTAARVHCREGP